MRFSTYKRKAKTENKEDNISDDHYKSAYQMLITDEETSAEFINPAKYSRRITTKDTATRTRNSFGVVALVFSIASLFFLPVILGSIGIIVGIFAMKVDSKVMGIAAFIIGVFSVLAGLLVYPFF